MTREEAIQALNEIFDDSEFSRYEAWYGTAMKMAIEALSAEAVDVVRCKDCKNRGSDACPMFFEDGYVDDDYRIHDHTESDGYCHWGEHKGGDDE